MQTRLYVESFGCRASQADAAALERALAQSGFQLSAAHSADVAILNTCTVTAAADSDARAAIRRLQRENPHCRILVTGCYAQRAPEEIAALPGVRWVVGNSHKHAIPALLSREFLGASSTQRDSTPPAAAGGHAAGVRQPAPAPDFRILVGDIFAHTELQAAPVFESPLPAPTGSAAARVRPNLKVQDGCNNRCSFCVIPSVRGRSRSLALEEILRELRAIVSLGYREVVISGINLGQWGRDLSPRNTFTRLVRAILDRSALEKLRISSVEPMDWNDELIELVGAHPRIARHAHVPLQSGSDAVLRRMHRRYRPWHYAQRIRKIRAASPTAAIGADVMVGFPGETDQEFDQSRQFVACLPFTYLHVFTYSARPGTAAAAAPGQVPVEVGHERSRILRRLAAEKNLEFRHSFLGGELQAITLARGGAGWTEALTDNYLKLRLRGDHAPNQWTAARIEAVTEGGLAGSVANRPDRSAII